MRCELSASCSDDDARLRRPLCNQRSTPGKLIVFHITKVVRSDPQDVTWRIHVAELATPQSLRQLLTRLHVVECCMSSSPPQARAG